MRLSADAKPKLEVVLDALASKLGIVSAVGLLFGICFGVALYLQSVVTQLEKDHEVFEDRQVRNGYVAISDMQRLVRVAQQGVNRGGFDARLGREFQEAADILYVRVDHFRSVLKSGSDLAEGELAIEALQDIVEMADSAIAAKFPDPINLVDRLLRESARARAHLVKFLDIMRRQADQVLVEQSYVVRKQQRIVIANLAGLTLVGSVALLFLRREVLGRRAREKAEKRVAFLAFFDPLTELPNRTQFQDRLSESLSQKQALALVYIDLDDFKLINDTYGHPTGDMVLGHVAALLRDEARELNGFAARLGGDEFALVIPSSDLEILTNLCDRIIAKCRDPLLLEGETVNFGVSIGLVTSQQIGTQEALTVNLLSRVADFALYTSKASGRNKYTVYDQDLERKFWDRRRLIEELPKAITNQELEVHLQPKVILETGEVFGFEALVRWRRDKKLLSPAEFILVAEESGLVVDVDHFVLDRATQLISDWNDKHGTSFSVSINLSALHFSSQRIVHWVEQSLWNAALRSDAVTLKITETMEMRDWKKARHVITELKALGCKIAIDDFGTGFSSLAYLRTMHADELKIDRSLVEELETSEKARLMLTSVLDIARNLELDVIVEGIETQEQADILLAMGARSGQGYFFGRPTPPIDAMSAAMATLQPPRVSRMSG